MQYSFDWLVAAYLQALENAPACASRDAAYALISSTWLAVHQRYGSSVAYQQRLQQHRLCREDGWHDLEHDPCYLDKSHGLATIRVNLHRDGAIVIQEMSEQRCNILLARPGIGLRQDLPAIRQHLETQPI